MEIKYFKSAAECRQWLERNHDKTTEQWFGFYKKKSGKRGITYQEALDEALCFGWIDGLKKSVDEYRYTFRFTPRKPKSIWSLVNTKRAEELRKLGRMKPAGLKALAARNPEKSGIYSFENASRELSASCEKEFKAHKEAWGFFQAQPPGYRRTASFWVMSAKKEETRLRRLARLISESEKKTRPGVISGKAARTEQELDDS
ncbi:YdeI/OmpD-associated family protein [soil metagenome]